MKNPNYNYKWPPLHKNHLYIYNINSDMGEKHMLKNIDNNRHIYELWNMYRTLHSTTWTHIYDVSTIHIDTQIHSPNLIFEFLQNIPEKDNEG